AAAATSVAATASATAVTAAAAPPPNPDMQNHCINDLSLEDVGLQGTSIRTVDRGDGRDLRVLPQKRQRCRRHLRSDHRDRSGGIRDRLERRSGRGVVGREDCEGMTGLRHGRETTPRLAVVPACVVGLHRCDRCCSPGRSPSSCRCDIHNNNNNNNNNNKSNNDKDDNKGKKNDSCCGSNSSKGRAPGGRIAYPLSSTLSTAWYVLLLFWMFVAPHVLDDIVKAAERW
ncbi:unnamed protein product, partial [Sphacelaria rigidula]